MILTPTKATGAVARPDAVLYVEPERVLPLGQVPAALSDAGVDGTFVLDLLSAVLTHERCGAHLYRSVAQRSNNPMLREAYERFGEQTRHHVDVLERLIVRVGGNPGYVSARARAVEATDAKVLESTYLCSGTMDPMTAEAAMLDAVLLAEVIDHANWSGLAQLAEAADGELEAALTDAVAEVEPDEDEHLEWARTTRARLTMVQAGDSVVGTVALAADEAIARIRQWFH